MGGAAEVDSIMARADVNGDGEISYDEYVRLMNMEKFGDAQVSTSLRTVASQQRISDIRASQFREGTCSFAAFSSAVS